MKSFKFKVHDNNYKVKLLAHEGNHIELEVNGTKYDVKLKVNNPCSYAIFALKKIDLLSGSSK